MYPKSIFLMYLKGGGREKEKRVEVAFPVLLGPILLNRFGRNLRIRPNMVK
jgi:hypothetical protein